MRTATVEQQQQQQEAAEEEGGSSPEETPGEAKPKRRSRRRRREPLVADAPADDEAVLERPASAGDDAEEKQDSEPGRREAETHSPLGDGGGQADRPASRTPRRTRSRSAPPIASDHDGAGRRQLGARGRAARRLISQRRRGAPRRPRASRGCRRQLDEQRPVDRRSPPRRRCAPSQPIRSPRRASRARQARQYASVGRARTKSSSAATTALERILDRRVWAPASASEWRAPAARQETRARAR